MKFMEMKINSLEKLAEMLTNSNNDNVTFSLEFPVLYLPSGEDARLFVDETIYCSANETRLRYPPYKLLRK